jgi:hypothetical protein
MKPRKGLGQKANVNRRCPDVPIFNLDHSSDRLKFQGKQFPPMGSTFEHIPAVALPPAV